MTSTKKTFKPTQALAKNAQKGLDFHNQYEKGGTDIGVNRAKQLIAQEELTEDDIKIMYGYFARHEVDKKAEDFGNDENPSKGYIAWLLWGGDEGREWVDKQHEILQENKQST